MKKKKYLFIDRDGTIIAEPYDEQVDKLEKFVFLPNVITALRNIVAETDYKLVMVTNQDGLGTDSFPMSDFLPLQELMLRTLEGEGISFEEVLIDETFPHDNSPNRKPHTGMVKGYMNEILDTENSYVIGDRATDVEMAVNMSIKAIQITDVPTSNFPVAFNSTNWNEVYKFLKNNSRRSTVNRKTNETDISITVDLNGTGKADINTGIGFFDHMIEQIAKHGGIDLTIQAEGDLHIDEHHTIEDTGIVLGQAFVEALSSKKGIERYGFALPMDESEAKVLLDFGGRTYLVWDVELHKDYVGDFPTDMAKHFFEAFCQNCACNLNISAKGDNTHHILEAVFKAFARCIKQAVRQNGGALPSSKGVL